MKKIFVLLLATMLIYLLPGLYNKRCVETNDVNLYKSLKNTPTIDTRKINEEDCKRIIPLYNAEGMQKYVYYEFIYGGYTIVHEETGEVVEQADVGKIDFIGEINYYFGPLNYISKIDSYYLDIHTNKTYDILDDDFFVLSNKIDMMFDEEKELIMNSKKNLMGNDLKLLRNNPEYNGNDLLLGKVFDINYSTMISNYEYFLSAPVIGLNDGSTNYNMVSGICGPVAAQLLLSYLNYYIDRRLIDDNFLNGYNYITHTITDYNQNPNYCDNPNDMSGLVIGTSSDLLEEESFINYFIDSMMGSVSGGTTHLSFEAELSNYLSNYYGYSYSVDIYDKGDYNYDDITNRDNIFQLAKNCIDNDTPFVLGIGEHPDYRHHYTIGYGYAEYYIYGYDYTYKGYVIHNGWYNSTPNDDIWVNSIFADYFYEIDIEHTHNYDIRVLSPNSTTYEYRCSTCGHRTAHVIDFNYLNNSNRMIEKNIIFDGWKNRIKEYYIKTDSLMNKIITTISQVDLYMELRYGDGTYITCNDNQGYGQNPLIKRELTANTWYRIRIRLDEYINFSDRYNLISILLLIFNSNRDQTTEFTDFDILSSSKTSYLERNESLIYRFTPPSTGSYTFKTDYSDSAIVDTYMYIYNMTDITDKAYNDDGAGNSQATITKNLTYDTSYLIIITAYNPNTQNGVVSLLLNNNRAQLPSSIKTSRIMRNTINVTSSSGTYTDKYGNNAYKVTDSSMTSSSQPKFVLDLTNLGINLPTLQNSPYQSVLIFIQFSVYEISDGYQKIYIRNQAGNNYVNPITNMEHGSGYKDGNYTTYVFYAEIPKSSINSTYLEINFSASGSGNDDWVFINPVVRAGYSSQTASNGSILNFEGLCVKDF